MGTFRPQMLAAGAAVVTALSLAGCQASPIPAEDDGSVSPGTPVVAARPKPRPEAKSDPDVAERVAAVVEAHNRERKEAGLPP